MQTSPSPGLEFYQGHVDVVVDEDASRDDIFHAAVRELRRTAFPDRGSRCWTMTGYSEAKQ
jgi:hypothetical protein